MTIEWLETKKNIGLNKQKRYNWKLILGKSLTAYITSLKSTGMTSEEVIKALMVIVYTRNPDYICDELNKRIKISVYARFTEQKSYEIRTKRNI